MSTLLPANEGVRLSALRAYQILETPPEGAFDDLTRIAAQICDTPIALLSLVDEKRQWFKSKVGIELAETPRDLGFCARAILQEDDVLEVQDALADPRFGGSDLVKSPPHARFYAGAPLVDENGNALGTLCVMDVRPRSLSPDQRCALRALGRQAVAQLELRRHAHELSEHARTRKQAEDQLREQNERLAGSQQETARLLELAEKSRGALLSVLEDEQRTSQALVSSLHEKEALLKEVHHRVKNNLQIIASLLRMEARRIEHALTKSVLRDMQGRIQSMALLHETLYRSGNFSRVDLSSYLSQLATQLFRSLVAHPSAVKLNLDLAPVHLDIDQAIPCGLIVNELASNSLKHGFPDGRTGEVWIRLRAAEADSFVLSVRDSGAGMPKNFDLEQQRSLGLQLVSDLARQLQGSLKIGPGPEAVFEVTFIPSREHRPATPEQQA